MAYVKLNTAINKIKDNPNLYMTAKTDNEHIYDIENENLDKDDDIIDYEEEEPLNLHEIDIFKDYSSCSFSFASVSASVCSVGST